MIKTKFKKTAKKLITYYWRFRAQIYSKKIKNYSQPVAVFFLPESAIQIYINTMLVVASQLRLLGHKIIFLRCYSVLPRCIYMDSVNFDSSTSYDKADLCAYCYSSFEGKVKKANFDIIDLRNLVQTEDYHEVNHIINNNPGRPFSFEKDGIKLTELLKYNFFLYSKSTNLINLDKEKLKIWQDSFRTLYIGCKIFTRLKSILRISHIFMVDEYSFNLVIKNISFKDNIIFKSLLSTYHKDVDVEKIKIINRDTLTDIYHIKKNWSANRKSSLKAGVISEITDDLLFKMAKKGTFTYSPIKNLIHNILNNLQLCETKKTIVAYTSSPDEIEALLAVHKSTLLDCSIDKDAFSTQLEWLLSLVEFVEARKENLQLIIRIHPRMAPNHREIIGCDTLGEFREQLSSICDNVKVIWPEQKISSYDIAEVADVVTVAWSSMGIDMARLSIPVISGFTNKLPLPNDNFHVLCSTKEDFFNRLTESLNKKANLTDILLAYRWYYAAYLGHSVDLSDVFASTIQGKPTLSKNSSTLEKGLMYDQSVYELNLSQMQEINQDMNNRVEMIELKKQLERVIYYLITNDDPFESKNKSQIDFKNFKSKKGYVSYTSVDGRKFKKYSPLIERLFKLIDPRSLESVHVNV
jgi:hypothetical protein